MAALTTQRMSYPSTQVIPASAAAGGDTVDPGDTTRLVVRNGGGAPITVTIPRYPTTDAEGVAETSLAVSVPNGQERWIGPLYGARFMNPATNKVEVSYSAVTSVTVMAIAT